MADAPSPIAALDKLLVHTARQLELLEGARARPDTDLGGLSRTALEMTLKGMKASVAPLADDDAVPADVRARIAAFVAAVDRYERDSVRLGQHLVALSAGWKCGKCNSDVAKGASLSGVALGKGFVKLELVCAECGARSQPTPQGRKLFEEKFGHLVKEGWNPDHSGFQWDRT